MHIKNMSETSSKVLYASHYERPSIELSQIEPDGIQCASPLTLKFNLSRSSSPEDPTSGWGGTEKEF